MRRVGRESRLSLNTPGGAVAALIVTATIVRLLMAAALGLGIDESYMVAAGRQVQWGYFDHPPLAWWLATGAARLFSSEAPVVVRLPFIALFAVSTWLTFRLGATLFGPRAGAWAALALNLAPVFGVTSGGWVLPDGPLDCALLAAAACLVHALPAERHAWHWWLGAGVAAGLALLSKYTAALVLAGAFLYLLTAPAHRPWLRRSHPYVAALLALALFVPVVAWNAMHGWASLGFQGGRATAERLYPAGPLIVLGGEALYLLPWLWLAMMMALVQALRAGPADWRRWLPACLGLPPIVLFALVGLWTRHVMFHWAAPGYLMLFPLLGAALERWAARWPRMVRGTAWATAGLLCAGLALVAGEVRWGWPPLPTARVHPGADPALDAVDWTALRAALADRPGAVVGAMNWREAGKIDYALGGTVPVICLNADRRQYAFVPQNLPPAGDMVIVATKPVTRARLAGQGYAVEALSPLPSVLLAGPGRPGLTLFLYAARGLRPA
ncbi:MAG: glycosyltransferase family 39 protein [Alphaproteobacteria bacterium]|nr:glycosyltransferase family 39 protein [Alphaproteobacteria bacterium]